MILFLSSCVETHSQYPKFSRYKRQQDLPVVPSVANALTRGDQQQESCQRCSFGSLAGAKTKRRAQTLTDKRPTVYCMFQNSAECHPHEVTCRHRPHSALQYCNLKSCKYRSTRGHCPQPTCGKEKSEWNQRVSQQPRWPTRRDRKGRRMQIEQLRPARNRASDLRYGISD